MLGMVSLRKASDSMPSEGVEIMAPDLLASSREKRLSSLAAASASDGVEASTSLGPKASTDYTAIATL